MKKQSKILVKEFESLMELLDWLDFNSDFYYLDFNGEVIDLASLSDLLVSGKVEEGDVLESLDKLDGVECFLGENGGFVLRVDVDKLK